MNCIGIDLGTCLSSVAVIGDNGKPAAIRIDTGSSSLIGDSYSIPSSVFIEEDGTILLGQAADNSRMKNPARYRKDFKRDLGTDEPYHIGDIEFFPEELYREFMKYFKLKAEEALGKAVDKAVVSHPANFAGHKKELIRKAAIQAGFPEVELIDDPTAAAVYYSNKEKIRDGEKLLVYDLGGGTFDVSFIIKEDGGFRPITPPLGIDKCGGIDFQKKIYEDILNRFSSDITPILSKRDMAARRFSSIIEGESIKLKHQLSASIKAEATIMLPSMQFENYSISREAFEKLIYEDLKATCSKTEEIIKNSGFSIEDIDRVLLVGGSSRIPCVEEMLKKITGKSINKDVDTELVVCYGAVLYGIMKKSYKASFIEEELNKKEYKSEKNTTEQVKNEEWYFNEGLRFYREGRLQEAVNFYNDAIKLKPYSYKFYKGKGEALMKLKRYEEAIECFRVYLPNPYREVKDYNLEAIKNYKAAWQKFAETIYGNDAEYYYSEGEKYYKKDDLLNALENFKRATLLKPTEKWLIKMGDLFREVGLFREAINSYKEALEINSCNKFTCNKLGVAYAKLESYEDAIRYFDKCLYIDSDYKLAINNKKMAEKNKKHKEQLEHAYDEYYEGKRLYEGEKYEEALKCFETAAAIEENEEYLQYKALALDKLKRYDEAISNYNKALVFSPNNAYILNNLGVAYQNKGDSKEAARLYIKAIQSDPKFQTPADNILMLL